MSLGRRVKSKYDDFFVRTEESAKCKICEKALKYSSASGPNSLKYHLQNTHKAEYEKVCDEEVAQKRKREEVAKENKAQSTIPFPSVSRVTFKVSQSPVTVTESISKWEESGIRTKAVDTAIMEMIASDVLPLRTVEKPGFLNLMKVVAPKMKIRSRYYYTNTLLPELEDRLTQKIKEDLLGMEKIALTCDGWSSKDGKQSLLSITGHWIDKNTFTPKFAIIGSCAIKGRHTADNLATILSASLSKFDIPLKSVACVVRDGGPNMEATTNRLMLNNFHCYAHNIQLCVKDTLEVITEANDVILKMKKVVRKTNKSHVCRDLFKNLQNQENLPQRMLKKDCDVRWSSMFLMLQSFLENRRAVSILQVDNTKLELPVFSTEDWNLMSVLHDILKPLADTTKSVQSRFDACASVIIPSIKVLQFKLKKMKKEYLNHDPMRVEIIDKLSTAIQNRSFVYRDDDFLKTCSFLDPRFKDSFFSLSHKDYMIRKLRIITDFHEEEEELNDIEKQNDEASSSLFMQFLKETTPETEKAGTDAAVEEIEEYLKTPPCEHTDPYKYWELQTNTPILKKMALEYLCVPATSSESERLFSLAGLICTPKRSNLAPERLDQLTFCSQNLKIFGFNMS